jgi:hypothetical protein
MLRGSSCSEYGGSCVHPAQNKPDRPTSKTTDPAMEGLRVFLQVQPLLTDRVIGKAHQIAELSQNIRTVNTTIGSDRNLR